MVVLLTMLVACAPAADAEGNLLLPVPNTELEIPWELIQYDKARARLEARRVELGQRWARGDETALQEARTVLLHSVTEELFPAWYGTEWEFYGTTDTPGQGGIACGHFVGVILEHAGFRVDRILLGQQLSEHIATTMVPRSEMHRWRHAMAPDVAAGVAELGDGLYILGLDMHAGWLTVLDGEVRMCHSDYNYPGVVACQHVPGAEAFYSDYRVVGSLLNDWTLARWLEGREFPIRKG